MDEARQAGLEFGLSGARHGGQAGDGEALPVRGGVLDERPIGGRQAVEA